MRFADIHSALMTGWKEGGFDIECAYENKSFKPKHGTPWARFSLVPADVNVASLGPTGDDQHVGFLQVDLHYPTDEGTHETLLMADQIARQFYAGARFTYERQCVRITSCRRGNGFVEDGWFRTPITIYWRAHVSRAVVYDALLLESDDELLLESGDRLLLEF